MNNLYSKYPDLFSSDGDPDLLEIVKRRALENQRPDLLPQAPQVLDEPSAVIPPQPAVTPTQEEEDGTGWSGKAALAALGAGLQGGNAAQAGMLVKKMIQDKLDAKKKLEQEKLLKEDELKRKAIDEQKNFEEKEYFTNKNNAAAMERAKVANSYRNSRDLIGDKKDFYNTASKLREEYKSDPTTKTTKSIHDAYLRMKESATKGTPASDQGLIFSYMKILDPSSTVREGEYASAADTRGVPDKIRAAYNKAIDGVILTPKQRADFLNQAKSIHTGQMKSQNQVRDTYTKLAKEYELPENLVTDIGLNDESAQFPMKVINNKTGESTTVDNEQELKEANSEGFY